MAYREIQAAIPTRVLVAHTTSSSIERKLVFVQPSFSPVIERAWVHFCPHGFNENYQNVSVLLSKVLSKWSLLRHLGRES